MRLKTALKALKDKRDDPNAPKVPENIITDSLYDKVSALRDMNEAFEECHAAYEKLSLVKQENFNLQSEIDTRLDMIERAMDRMYMLLPCPTAEGRFKEALGLYRTRLMELVLGRVWAELPAVVAADQKVYTATPATTPKPAPAIAAQAGLF